MNIAWTHGKHVYSSLIKLTVQAWLPSWSTLGKSEQLPLTVRWPDQPPTLQPQSAQVNNAQSWTALFRAFSSYQQPTAYLTKGIPKLDKFFGLTGQLLTPRKSEQLLTSQESKVDLTTQESTTKDVKLVQFWFSWLSLLQEPSNFSLGL